MNKSKYAIALMACCIVAVAGCAGKTAGNTAQQTADEAKEITFNADSAYSFVARQCAFGERVPNTDAHSECGDWIASRLRQCGATVTEQRADLKAFDGTLLHARNIVGEFYPEKKRRVLLVAHWDCRPWADSDPNPDNRRKPVMGANDGASGVAVMLEIARLLASDTTKLNLGIDFVCFDAEDRGVPRWSTVPDNGDSWALGAQHWAANPHKPGYEARFGILLDMVGGQGSKFSQEGLSKQYAQGIVDKVWAAAEAVGFGSYFPSTDGVMVTDDHVPVNDVAKIPTIDIVPYYPDCQQSSFGPTWHTINDTMEYIDKNTLQAVGQTVIQVLYSEKP